MTYVRDDLTLGDICANIIVKAYNVNSKLVSTGKKCTERERESGEEEKRSGGEEKKKRRREKRERRRREEKRREDKRRQMAH